jgi:hypothetical protein
MLNMANNILIIAAFFDAVAAIAHLVCIFIGGAAFRFLGAGERLASEFEAGKISPILITVMITFVLCMWGIFSLSGAGVIETLPLTKWVLLAISGVLIIRALFFPLLKPYFPENSMKFWFISSALCLIMGSAHLWGVVSRWHQL